VKTLDWKKINRGATICVIIFCVAGCAPRYSELGANTVAYGSGRTSGRAYLAFPASDRQRNCDDILLVPQKAEYRQIVLTNFGEDESKLLQDIKFVEIYDDFEKQRDVKSVDCDSSGRFSFTHLADGDYYLIARSTWLLRLAHRGGVFSKQVHVPQDRDGIIVSSIFGGG
jgi:hypothetical protein